MIYLGSDHAGFKLKEAVKAYLQEQGIEAEDLGAFEFVSDDDYPDFVRPVAEKVALRQAQGENDTFGIVFGGSGQGEAMVANKVKGIRAGVYYGGNLDIVRLLRAHNDTNILSLGARFIQKQEALEAVRAWLATSFEGGRHVKRIQKMSDEEQ